MVDEAIEKRRPLAYAFMDVRKAFDSVSHRAPKVAYRRAGLPEGFIGKTWLGRITKSVLKPQQKLEILKTNVIPRLLYEVGLEYRSAGFLNDLDIQVRRAVWRWLHLPGVASSSLVPPRVQTNPRFMSSVIVFYIIHTLIN